MHYNVSEQKTLTAIYDLFNRVIGKDEIFWNRKWGMKWTSWINISKIL